MIRYWWAIMVGAIFGLCSCQWSETTEAAAIYPIQGITAYQGQNVSELFDANGAPNSVQNMPNGSIVWTYYTNYQPIGGGELISYNIPQNNNSSTNCVVKVQLNNDVVSSVSSNCQ